MRFRDGEGTHNKHTRHTQKKTLPSTVKCMIKTVEYVISFHRLRRFFLFSLLLLLFRFAWIAALRVCYRMAFFLCADSARRPNSGRAFAALVPNGFLRMCAFFLCVFFFYLRCLRLHFIATESLRIYHWDNENISKSTVSGGVGLAAEFTTFLLFLHLRNAFL